MGQSANIKRFQLMSISMSSLGHVRMASFLLAAQCNCRCDDEERPCKGAVTLNAQAGVLVGDIPGIALE